MNFAPFIALLSEKNRWLPSNVFGCSDGFLVLYIRTLRSIENNAKEGDSMSTYDMTMLVLAVISIVVGIVSIIVK